MKRAEKKCLADSGNLDLFELSNNKANTFYKYQESSNVISFSFVANRKKDQEQSSLEKEALKSILARANKLNW